MKNNISIAFIVLVTWPLMNAGCSIKPPDDGSDMGAEVSAAKVQETLASAQTGTDFDKAFRIGDTGITEEVNRIMTNIQTVGSHVRTVTAIDSAGVTLTDLDQATGKQQDYFICRPKKATAYKSKALVPENIFARLPSFLAGPTSYLYFQFSHFISKISVEKSQAIGGEIVRESHAPRWPFLSLRLTPSQLNQIERIRGGERVSSYDSLASPGPSSGTSPSAAPDLCAGDNTDNSTDSTARYFGLKIFNHPLTTADAAQIPGGKVNATHIEFNELIKSSNGDLMRLHRLYEISTEVPGLFFVLQDCFSVLVIKDGSQIPWNHCYNVTDFRFGSN